MNIHKSYVKAAEEEDPFDDMSFDEPDDDRFTDDADAQVEEKSPDSVDDSLDNIEDTLDDINDALDSFQEDNIDIDTENNISDHYIAECEKCHGIFITAVTESDQKIDRISGTCPLCDQDCDQYLKWVVKDVD